MNRTSKRKRRWPWLKVAIAGNLVWLLSAANNAQASELRWQGTDQCEGERALRRQVGTLLEESREAVAGVDFEVSISRDPENRWKSHIRIQFDGQPWGQRTIEAASCREAVDAAAVAIAMTVTIASQRPSQIPRATPTPLTATHTTLNAPASEVPTPDQPKSPPNNWAGRLGIGGVINTSLLPQVAFGASITGAVLYGHLALRGRAGMFADQEKVLDDGVSGNFSLLLAGLDGCLYAPSSSAQLSGCLGLGAYQLTANGAQVTRAYTRSQWFGVAQGEVALTVPLWDAFALGLRTGLSVPLSRPKFVIDTTRPIHRVGNLAAQAGVELLLLF